MRSVIGIAVRPAEFPGTMAVRRFDGLWKRERISMSITDSNSCSLCKSPQIRLQKSQNEYGVACRPCGSAVVISTKKRVRLKEHQQEAAVRRPAARNDTSRRESTCRGSTPLLSFKVSLQVKRGAAAKHGREPSFRAAQRLRRSKLSHKRPISFAFEPFLSLRHAGTAAARSLHAKDLGDRTGACEQISV